MIDKLFQAQKYRLADALSAHNGTTLDVELASLEALLVTIEGGMISPFEAAGLRPKIAELAARAYSFGWADGISRHLGVTLADASILWSRGSGQMRLQKGQAPGVLPSLARPAEYVRVR